MQRRWFGRVRRAPSRSWRPPPARRRPRPPTAVEAIDTSDWTTYKSDLYDLEVGHPPGWTETPATRKWRLDDGRQGLPEPRARGLPAPRRYVRVSVWAAPLDPTTREETTDYLEAWVEDYCEAIGQHTVHRDRRPRRRAVPREVGLPSRPAGAVQGRRPGLLQRRHLRRQDAMTVVAVWRPESAPPAWRRTAVPSGSSKASCPPWRSGPHQRQGPTATDYTHSRSTIGDTTPGTRAHTTNGRSRCPAPAAGGMR